MTDKENTPCLLLRHAAGSWWLIDTSQPGLPYRRPVKLNDTGARIWQLMASGLSEEETAAVLASEEGLSVEEITADVREFSAALGMLLRSN